MTTDSQNKKADLLTITAGVICLGLAIGLSTMLENKRTVEIEYADAEELSLQGGKLKGFTLGFDGLLADWYWIRSLQYIGDKLFKAGDKQIDIDNLKPLDPKLLYPFLDNATTLDPNFMAVYSYGATVLPAIEPKHAIAIAKKGIKHNPDEWMLYHQLGFIYWKLGDYENAAETYKKGSAIKGAPDWMKSMSARMSDQAGSRETARAIYKQVFDSAGDAKTRDAAELRLLELDSFDERDALNEALGEFKTSNGQCAKDWNQLHSILAQKQLPNQRDFRIDEAGNVVDPTGTPYKIDANSCESRLDKDKTKLPRN